LVLARVPEPPRVLAVEVGVDKVGAVGGLAASGAAEASMGPGSVAEGFRGVDHTLRKM
jgi:hypothetical protein